MSSDHLKNWDPLEPVINILESTDQKQTKLPPPSILEKAEQLIHGARQADYGDKLDNFTQIAMGMQMVLARKLAPGAQLSAEDAALCMMQVKIARLAHMPDHEDSLVDVAGYAGCYECVQQERKARDPLDICNGLQDSRKDLAHKFYDTRIENAG